jgi:hypothetical protein
MLLVCHFGLDPRFDRPFDQPFDRLTVLSIVEGLTVLSIVAGLTVLSKIEGLTVLSVVEGESSSVSATYASGCRSEIPSLAGIKSGMTVRK